MTNYKFGDIVIIAFPYTNLNNVVVRPAMVVMDNGDEDIIVAKITSQKRDLRSVIEVHNWKSKKLTRLSYVRLSKLATLNRRDIKNKISSLDDEDIVRAKNVLRDLLNIKCEGNK